jgi:hypothetical protein
MTKLKCQTKPKVQVTNEANRDWKYTMTRRHCERSAAISRNQMTERNVVQNWHLDFDICVLSKGVLDRLLGGWYISGELE